MVYVRPNWKYQSGAVSLCTSTLPHTPPLHQPSLHSLPTLPPLPHFYLVFPARSTINLVGLTLFRYYFMQQAYSLKEKSQYHKKTRNYIRGQAFLTANVYFDVF